jgi:hypothetical protein
MTDMTTYVHFCSNLSEYALASTLWILMILKLKYIYIFLFSRMGLSAEHQWMTYDIQMRCQSYYISSGSGRGDTHQHLQFCQMPRILSVIQFLTLLVNINTYY